MSKKKSYKNLIKSLENTDKKHQRKADAEEDKKEGSLISWIMNATLSKTRPLSSEDD
jgi:hypothetical protein